MDKENIKHFALDVLGCGCDHSVFDLIEVTDDVKLHCGVRLGKKILIGRRLLIYISSAECCAPGDLDAVIREGLAERNGSGYNRLRLVIVTPETGSIKDAYVKAFGNVSERDEKCHLHIVRPGDAV